jgi:subtilisin family serine protease
MRTPRMLPTLSEASRAIADGDGAGVRIAVLDTGVEWAHPDLKQALVCDDLEVAPVDGRLALVPGSGRDLYGHGTAIASLLVELAPRAELGSYRVLNGLMRSRSHVIAFAAHRAIEAGYRILNCSFGCRGDLDYILPHKDWTDHAYLAQVCVVAASSNRGFHVSEWPAHFSSVVSVDAGKESLRSLAVRTERSSLVEFLAPGKGVRVAWLAGSHRVVSGTSYAAPIATALIARLLSAFPDLGPDEVKALLRRIHSER